MIFWDSESKAIIKTPSPYICKNYLKNAEKEGSVRYF